MGVEIPLILLFYVFEIEKVVIDCFIFYFQNFLAWRNGHAFEDKNEGERETGMGANFIPLEFCLC